jgi:hypothetical protein
MPKLNQIVAVEKGLKSRTGTAITKIYHDFQKPALYAGLARKYQPVEDGGDTFPPESTLVQKNVSEQLQDAADVLTKLVDTVATKEEGNRHAVADVVVDGVTVVAGAPVPLLLFLEKQLVDFRTMVSKVPTLDPAEEWEVDPNNSTADWRTPAAETTRTRKVPKTLVKYPATDKHPAQTEVYTVDEVVGHWATTKFSGAMAASKRDAILDRVDTLADAVKKAREEANSIEVQQVHVGAGVFDYLLG